MGSKQKQGQNKPRPQAPIGPAVARCLWIIDLGTQEQEFKGVAKAPAREILFKFELVKTNHVFTEEKGPQPFTLLYPNFGGIKWQFTEYQGKKSKLWDMVDTWRAREWSTEEKADGIEMEKFLGKPALITVISKPKKGDPSIKYSNISAVSALPAEMGKAPALRNPSIYFEIGMNVSEDGKLGKNAAGETQFDVFELLPKFIQENIAKSPEWQDQSKKFKYAGPKKEEAATADAAVDDEGPIEDDAF